MDNKKKIIVAVVGILAVGILVFLLGGDAIAANNATPTQAQGLDFDGPKVKDKLLEVSTKKEMYDSSDEEFDKEKYDSLAGNLSFLQKMKKKFDPREPKVVAAPVQKEENVDKELQMLMAMQNNLGNQAVRQQGYAPMPTMPTTPTPVATPVVKKVIPQEGNYFFGASSGAKNAGENLIPAETIDQALLKQGSTIAIRTKNPIIIEDQNIVIPKGAVIYGVVQFQQTRLNINISKYRRDNRLYSINVKAHDFDGRPGIHLKSRSIFSIPSNVSQDVYNTAIQTYRNQSNAFSSDERVPLDQVALLSAAKEVSRELFDKRRVFVPRKYHLWLTVKTTNEE